MKKAILHTIVCSFILIGASSCDKNVKAPAPNPIAAAGKASTATTNTTSTTSTATSENNGCGNHSGLNSGGY